MFLQMDDESWIFFHHSSSDRRSDWWWCHGWSWEYISDNLNGINIIPSRWFMKCYEWICDSFCVMWIMNRVMRDDDGWDSGNPAREIRGGFRVVGGAPEFRGVRENPGGVPEFCPVHIGGTPPMWGVSRNVRKMRGVVGYLKYYIFRWRFTER